MLGDRDQNATLARLQYYTRYLTQRDSRRQASSCPCLEVLCSLRCMLRHSDARNNAVLSLSLITPQGEERKLRRMMDATSGQGRPIDTPTDTALGEPPAPAAGPTPCCTAVHACQLSPFALPQKCPGRPTSLLAMPLTARSQPPWGAAQSHAHVNRCTQCTAR